MNHVLEFLAENYIYVAGGSAVIIVILLMIIALGNKKVKKEKVQHVKITNDVIPTQNIDSNGNVNMGIPEPVLEPVPNVQNVESVMPTVEPQVTKEAEKGSLEIFDI